MTQVSDDFNRANSTSSPGPAWTNFHPNGFLGWTANNIGVNSNQTYNSNAAANKCGACYSSFTPTGAVFAVVDVPTLPSDWFGLLLRVQNVNGISVKGYQARLIGTTSWDITRVDSQGSETTVGSGTLGTAFAAGYKLAAQCFTNGSGNVVIELWMFDGTSWSLMATATDTSGSKITTDGLVGYFIGNNGNTVGRFDNFVAGEMVDSDTPSSITTPSASELYSSPNIDISTISAVTSLTSSELANYTESSVVASSTSIGSSDLYTPFGIVYTDSGTISTKTSITSNDVVQFVETTTVKSVTTPDVILEVPTTVHIDISLSGSAYVGGTLTAVVNITIDSGGVAGGGGGVVITDPDQPGYVSTYSPTGQWGSSDDDNGVIV